MCGIIGIIGKNKAAQKLLEGLKCLEYRGYDSAGIATVSGNEIKLCRSEGKIRNLEEKLSSAEIDGSIGIGHTRWATHGSPATKNAHPHATERVAVVHNGIIENFISIRSELEGKGYEFASDTDTEVIPQLITYFLNSGMHYIEAVKATIAKLEGAYALGIIFSGNENLLCAVRHGSPLAIGHGEEMSIGSDAVALIHLTSNISYLEDGDIAFLNQNAAVIYDKEGNEVEREIVKSSISNVNIGKENYRHFMQKEIYEQPRVIGDVLKAYINPFSGMVEFPTVPFSIEEISKITIIACGTSYYAGVVSRYLFERITKIPVEVDIASEFRYRNAVLPKNGITIFISQSGETADTLAAMRYAKSQGQHTVAIINVPESTIAREADVVFPAYSGPEIGVASTKSFTTQLAMLACFILFLAVKKGTIQPLACKEATKSLLELPSLVSEVLHHDSTIRRLAKDLVTADSVIYIGRGISYGIALEGALKLKELSYIHAEAAAAGELKHGPIALVDENLPVIAIAPSDDLFEKTASNIREVAARGGKIILLSDEKGIEELKDVVYTSITLPETASFVSPILYAIPVQLLAYHVAVIKGTDVDQPRNLAKSVTVE